jgi:hypothetical protein
MQNVALERAGIDAQVDHRSHERRGIEQEPTAHMGPSATAMERRAEHQAMREGRNYEPVTAVGQHNERAGLRQYIERGTEWLRAVGKGCGQAARCSGQLERGGRARSARGGRGAARPRSAGAADRARQEAQERQQVRERELVVEKFKTIAGKREAARRAMATITATGRPPRRRCARRWTPITGPTRRPRIYIEKIQREPQMGAVGQLLHERAGPATGSRDEPMRMTENPKIRVFVRTSNPSGFSCSQIAAAARS